MHVQRKTLNIDLMLNLDIGCIKLFFYFQTHCVNSIGVDHTWTNDIINLKSKILAISGISEIVSCFYFIS